jgi:N-acyl-D-amino-acid deacylase
MWGNALAEQPPATVLKQTVQANAEIPSTGETNSQSAQLDALICKTLKEHGIPGAALAVARDGCLLYSRGFGYADNESHSPVQPDSLFRIASLSKPLTATAILKLREAGKLSVDDKVLSILDEYWISPRQSAKFDARLRDITVLHLLQHRAGWDRQKSGDPMFSLLEIAEAMGSQPPASQQDIMRYMLTQPLDFNPGDRYCYSNFGYCLLGRVIERLSGCGYEEFVQNELLAPIGITEMRLGRTLPQMRAAGEVAYYDRGRGRSVFDTARQEVPQPYGVWSLEAMDAHGGWIASAKDLVKFGVNYFGTKPCTRLHAESLRATIARPQPPDESTEDHLPLSYYGLGWQVLVNDDDELVQLSHHGSLPGTCSLLVCRADGTCYAVLLNSRESPLTDSVTSYIENDLEKTIQAIKSWPLALNLVKN